MGFVQVATRYYIKSKRLLLKSTRRPSGKELVITSRIVALGIFFIGFIGFIIGILVDFLVVSTSS
ncbi:MAG: protein translocase SEC61 complex subunit gamma [Candidatus Heimdallarchaeota archaeon]|nr:protein translocase SEC61 complex subunit gamma [Candidatus Heimdallarchaeota archaeon]